MASPDKGTSGDDFLKGGSLDDELYGYSGDDEVRGLSGDDRLSGGSGDDQLFGGSGDDELIGGSGDDILRGGSGDDDLSGGSGDDILSGGSGDDFLSGGSGDDLLRGGSGDDVLKGGSGDDILIGGTGDDVLSGGSGDDTFRFSGSFGEDVITDLKPNDTIDLTAFGNITDISDLTITQVGDDTLIEVPGSNGGTITVKGLAPSEVVGLIQVPCVVTGTLVRTPDGDLPVETLRIGDLVTTIDGDAVAIKWIGRRAYARPFIAAGSAVAPVLIRAGALGMRQPERDLMVSPEHAVYVDGVLVPARLLVNGRSIVQIREVDRVEYFHLEFDQPQVILTNGAPTESYVESGNRRMFANFHDYVARYGAEGRTGGEPLRRFTVMSAGVAIEAIRARLVEEARLAA